MPFNIAKGKSVDTSTQARVIKNLIEGDYTSAYKTFDKITVSDLKEVVNEYTGLLQKYSPYYLKNKKVAKLISKFVQDANAAASGNRFTMPSKKAKISYNYNYDDSNEANSAGETSTVEITASGNAEPVIGYREEPIPEIKPESKPRLEDDKTATKKIEGLAKKEKKDYWPDQPIQKIGLLGPHTKNTTDAAVIAAIGESPADTMRDFSNWFIFDLPTDSTGVGTAKTNPLVRQNQLFEQFNGEGDLFKSDLETYLLTDGPEEIKNFYGLHPDLLKSAFKAEMARREMIKNEAEFLAQFDSKNNGLFSQDQTQEERNNFRNTQQIPYGSYGQPDEYPMAEAVNPGIFVDSEITQNKNLFPDGNVSYF